MSEGILMVRNRSAPAFSVKPNQRPAPSANDTPEYLPSLDGLRALGVCMVLAFHVGQGYEDQTDSLVLSLLTRVTASGPAGVDLFFVLSGFLITGILLDMRGAPGYFRSFYARRSLRIFPLYYTYLALLPVLLASSAAYVAALSFRWIETPALRLKRYFPRPTRARNSHHPLETRPERL